MKKVCVDTCLSCGKALTIQGRIVSGDTRFCVACDSEQSRYAVVDAWRVMACRGLAPEDGHSG